MADGFFSRLRDGLLKSRQHLSGMVDDAVQEHAALLEAITGGEPSRALAAYREHLHTTREQLAHSLRLQG